MPRVKLLPSLVVGRTLIRKSTKRVFSRRSLSGRHVAPPTSKQPQRGQSSVELILVYCVLIQCGHHHLCFRTA